MIDIKIKDGKAIMSIQAFEELKSKSMIVYSGENPMFLYKGYAHKVVITN